MIYLGCLGLLLAWDESFPDPLLLSPLTREGYLALAVKDIRQLQLSQADPVSAVWWSVQPGFLSGFPSADDDRCSARCKTKSSTKICKLQGYTVIKCEENCFLPLCDD